MFASQKNRRAQLFCKECYHLVSWITVQCTPTEDRVDRGEAAEIVRSLFECLHNRSAHKNPIMLHVIGHKALPVHNAVCQFVEDEQDMGNSIPIKGCILDSCPKIPDGVLYQIKESWPTLYDFIILVMYMMRALYPELFSNELDVSDYDMFCYHSGMWPQLYLYSTVDHIVLHREVEKHIRVQMDNGVPIETKCWNDTEHARHIVVHQQEYTEVCQQFVQNCTEV